MMIQHELNYHISSISLFNMRTLSFVTGAKWHVAYRFYWVT